jgi:hypothetical protein
LPVFNYGRVKSGEELHILTILWRLQGGYEYLNNRKYVDSLKKNHTCMPFGLITQTETIQSSSFLCASDALGCHGSIPRHSTIKLLRNCEYSSSLFV